jgi:hypothetical protein
MQKGAKTKKALGSDAQIAAGGGRQLGHYFSGSVPLTCASSCGTSRMEMELMQ